MCNACRSHGKKEIIDWEKRAQSFRELAQNVKQKSSGYDCVIPVSGGKDSTWQVVTCLEHGLTPLAVTWKSPARTALGQKNLDNLVSLGVDHIDYQISPKTERIFMLEAFKRYGSTAIPMHTAIFSIPLRIAAKFHIPLIVWGENSALEYGGEEELQGITLDEAWIKKFGVTHGTTSLDWVSEKLTAKMLAGYESPSAAEMQNTAGIFLGYYFPWDVETSLRVAKAHGFQTREEGPRTGIYDYADIDDAFISIHHYLKWYKFGFTRSFDNLSLEIRNGRITREQAIEKLKALGTECPKEDIKALCAFLGISESEFFEICKSFRNTAIWKRNKGKWEIPGFLIEGYE